jgi:hypothetical protein
MTALGMGLSSLKFKIFSLDFASTSCMSGSCLLYISSV